MNKDAIVAVALLGGLVGACSGEVQVQSTSSGATGGSSGTGGASSSSSSSSGTGGACSVSLPAGCGCPDNASGAWAQAFSAPGNDTSNGVFALGTLPIAPDGSVVVAITSNSASSRLVKLDATGHLLWDQPADGVVWPTPDPRDCSTLVTGTIGPQSTDLLGQTVTCGSASCPFVARIDAGGAVVWIKVYDFGGDAWTTPSIAGVLADGRIALIGPFQGTIDLGNGPLVAPPSPGSAVFVALLSPEGDALWSRHFSKAHTGDFLAFGVVSSAGDITVTTSPDGNVDFGDGPISVPTNSYTGGLLLASYDPSGTLRFGKVFASAYGTTWPAIAQDSAGHVIIAERAEGDADFGGGPVGADPSAFLTAVAAYDADGQYLWSTGVDVDLWSGAIAVDAAHHVWLGVSTGEIVELDAAGALVATHTPGGSGKHFPEAIGFAPDGAPVIAGSFDGTLDLGAGAPLVAQSKTDAFVARLAP